MRPMHDVHHGRQPGHSEEVEKVGDGNTGLTLHSDDREGSGLDTGPCSEGRKLLRDDDSG